MRTISLPVHVAETAQNVSHHVNSVDTNFAVGASLLWDSVEVELWACQVLHDDEHAVVVDVGFVDVHDIRVVKSRQDLDFVHKIEEDSVCGLKF